MIKAAVGCAVEEAKGVVKDLRHIVLDSANESTKNLSEFGTSEEEKKEKLDVKKMWRNGHIT